MSRKQITGVDNVFNPSGAKTTESMSKDISYIDVRMYENMLMELAMNRFKWHGIPEEIEPTIIEKSLLANGLCIFFDDVNYGPYVALPGTPGAGLDIYANPNSYTVTSLGGGFTRTISKTDCVPIWPNTLRFSDKLLIRNYALILTEISVTIRTNTIQMRTPFVASAPESQRMSVANAVRQVMEGSPVLFLDSDFQDMNTIQVFNTSMHPNIILNSQLYKQKAWNECMTYLGINNANQEKPERLVADEVSANDSQVVMNRISGLSARKRAADAINSKYGLSVSVEWNSDIDAMADMVLMADVDNGTDSEKEDTDDGTVH